LIQVDEGRREVHRNTERDRVGLVIDAVAVGVGEVAAGIIGVGSNVVQHEAQIRVDVLQKYDVRNAGQEGLYGGSA
jgi:hypothetical protein